VSVLAVPSAGRLRWGEYRSGGPLSVQGGPVARFWFDPLEDLGPMDRFELWEGLGLLGRFVLWDWLRLRGRFVLCEGLGSLSRFDDRSRHGDARGIVVRPDAAVADEFGRQAVARDESLFVQAERIGLPTCGNFLHVSSLDLGDASKLRARQRAGTDTSAVSIRAISALNRAEMAAAPRVASLIRIVRVAVTRRLLRWRKARAGVPICLRLSKNCAARGCVPPP